MPTHQIKVTVENNSIHVTPDPLIMTTADEVHWAGTNSRRFKIVFDDDAAFGRRELDHATATARQKAHRRGRFKYTVVAEDDPGLVLDPVVVVGDPPTDPNT